MIKCASAIDGTRDQWEREREKSQKTITKTKNHKHNISILATAQNLNTFPIFFNHEVDMYRMFF